MSKPNNSQSGITSTKQSATSAHIDWISVTAKHSDVRGNENAVILLDDYKAGYKTVRATMGYAQARKYQSGAIMQWHDKHPSMGVHITYSSQAIRSATENFGLDAVQILDTLTRFGRVSRMDVCVDVANVPIDISQLYSDMKSGKVKTRAKTFDFVESAKVGNEAGARTAYVGSMHKRKKLLRVYDKGMQLNLDDYLTRFELEVHGVPAQHAARELMNSWDNFAGTIRNLIAGYADFSDTQAGKYLSSDSPIKLSHPKYQKSDTAKWLIEVVAKTLANESYKDYNTFEEFTSAFKYHFEQLIALENHHEG